MTEDRLILVLNAGSSSIKAAVFDAAFKMTLRAEASGIGAQGDVKVAGTRNRADLPDHQKALDLLLQGLARNGLALDQLRGVGHRVVHGGTMLTKPTRISPETRAKIADCIPLAPLHNPHNLAAIDAISRLAPDLPQTASFDTAFHTTNPEVAQRYAIPATAETQGLRRYGFHGTSYAALVRALPALSGAPLPQRLLALHLGNGASLCAIRDGQSVATTMGYSPVSGLTMGTRSGDIDAAAVLRLAETLGAAHAHRFLHHESGLLGLSGLSSDMRSLEEAETEDSRFAMAHFCYWAARHSGSMIAAMGGLDAIAFTGGIGENAERIREGILDHLSWAGAVPVWIVPAEEEAQIARDTVQVLGD
ncbi:acetate/propionate family kinase [Thalassococcus sp. S3]|uniref:acetate/propionate family kinase n=1 Tax=Thalassococcus sp. S3 TaxID=2017482 RepID=UPI001023F96A|nr:acetate/propionate family kinase [Thalassococcus sp. S3]QBF33103.1 acetate kinase [Thalassococcus sp. S3]